MLLVLIGLCCSCARYGVYPVQSRPRSAVGGGVVYALPQTRVVVDVTFVRMDRTTAPFADYAEELLGVELGREVFDVKGVSISSEVEADPKGSFYVVPRGTAVQVGENHLLHSVGLPYEKVRQLRSEIVAEQPEKDRHHEVAEYSLYDRSDTLYQRGDRPGSPSYVATGQDVKPTRRRAKEAVQLLKTLQQRREELLAGMTELQPEAQQALLEQVDGQLERLSEQFLGRRVEETVRFSVVPRQLPKGVTDDEVVLFYFSPEVGLVDSTYGGAECVVMKLHNLNTMREAARFVNYRADGPKDRVVRDKKGFKYRMAEEALVEVGCSRFCYQQRLLMAQYGPTVDLPRRRFQALFDERTGNLIYYGE